MNLNCQMNHVQYQIFKIILSIFLKNRENVDNPSITIYINKIENGIRFKIKNGYYLELLTPKTIKLLGSTYSKLNKDKNGENVSHLGIVELVLVHCSLANNDYQQDSRISYTFVPTKPFGSLLEILPTNHIKKSKYDLQIRLVSH